MESPAAHWGDMTRYLEIGEAQFAVRQVEVFSNGFLLRYDVSHWCDSFGQLLGCRFSQKPKWSRLFPNAIVIDSKTFERIWRRALQSPAMELTARKFSCSLKGAMSVWASARIGFRRPLGQARDRAERRDDQRASGVVYSCCQPTARSSGGASGTTLQPRSKTGRRRFMTIKRSPAPTASLTPLPK